jgi:hypothetical protein
MAGEQQQRGQPGDQQRSQQKFIVFDNFEKMNTQAAREALSENEASWIENLQPIGRNNLKTVPAPLPAIATLTGATVAKMFFANIGNVDYLIAFTTAGAGVAINAVSGGTTTFAADGTFSDPDCTQWESERILIYDQTAGYTTWDGTVFVEEGGLSPVITVTNGGTGYSATPVIGFTGGSGGGATATATVEGGVIVEIVLTNPGSGYLAGDTITVTITDGTGINATATAHIWPFITHGTTLAQFQGRVWLGSGRVLTYTGTAGYDDFDPSNASGSTTITDADLVHSITALRSLNNYLFIFGDNSIKQIGNITVSASVTLFSILTLSSDQGTTFPLTIGSYNRLVLFSNKVGVYAIFGASVQKISDDLDGIFAKTDFSQPIAACVNDIHPNNIHTYLLLLKYNDPVRGTRSIFCSFMNKKWFVIDQGDAIRAVTTAALASTGVIDSFASSGSDITPILQDQNTAVAFQLSTALSGHGTPLQRKKTVRGGFGCTVSDPVTINMAVESENGSVTVALDASTPVIWENNLNQVVTWQNNSAEEVTWGGVGFEFPYSSALVTSGKFIGATITGRARNFALNLVGLEYQDTALWG